MQKINIMKTYRFLFTFMTFVLVSINVKAQNFDNQQFYNYGFENWINENLETVEPEHWHSFKSASGSYGFLMSQQISPSNEKRPGSNGNRSAQIYSKSIVGITANGNMTTGRINAGSMNPTGSENYNYTQRNSDYCTPMTVLPDSLTVWVCFRAADSNSKASIITAIHGDANFQMLGDGGYYPADMLCATANIEYSRTCASGEGLTWKRLSIPFTAYPNICTDYRYILTTFTTNKDAGSGNAGDEVFIDDIYLIYNPYIEIEPIEQLSYHFPNDGSELEIEVAFTLSGTMSAENLNTSPNQVIAQLSDAYGNFTNPYELGRLTTNESGVIHGTIPSNVPDGDGYRIRVVSTNYPMTSDDNGDDIHISGSNDIDTFIASNIQIYPNPANNFIRITSDNTIEEINLFSLNGSLIYSDASKADESIIDISHYNPGIYIIKIISNEDIFIKKIIIE